MLTSRWAIEAMTPTGRALPRVHHFKHDGPTPFDEKGYHKHQEENASQQASGRIRCPHCQWQPVRNSRWVCFSVGPPENLASGGCGQGWNTFDTRGRCPGCKHQWRYTTCLSCGQWAPHGDWYVQGGGSGGAGKP